MTTTSRVRGNRRLARQPLDLAGKVVLITGGAGGLGQALAAALLDAGAAVALLDLTAGPLDAVAARLGADRVSTHLADVTDQASVDRAVAEVLDRHGRVDVLVNNAGISLAGSFLDSTPQQIEQVLDVNLCGAVRVLHAVLPHLPPGGHLVSIASMSGVVGMPFSSAYSASKFGLRGLTETLALELPERGVGVSLVLLGGTNTGLTDNLRYAEHTPEPMRARLRKATERSTAVTSAPAAADAVVAGLRRRRPTIVVGPDARVMVTLSRVAPRLLRRLLSLVK